MRQMTLDTLAELGLEGMKRALKEQLSSPSLEALSFDERFDLLVEPENAHRTERRLATRIKKASVRFCARLEELDYRAVRSLDRALVDSLASCRWLKENRNAILTGPTGIGKTFLASALTLKACNDGFSARYFRAPSGTCWPSANKS